MKARALQQPPTDTNPLQSASLQRLRPRSPSTPAPFPFHPRPHSRARARAPSPGPTAPARARPPGPLTGISEGRGRLGGAERVDGKDGFPAKPSSSSSSASGAAGNEAAGRCEQGKPQPAPPREAPLPAGEGAEVGRGVRQHGASPSGVGFGVRCLKRPRFVWYLRPTALPGSQGV